MAELKPYSEYKDSGIEWIGVVPEHWMIARMKRYIKVMNGKEIKTEIESSESNSIEVYGSGGVFKYTYEYIYDDKSVLFGRKGTIGKPIYVSKPFWTVDTMYFTKFFKNTYSKWFYYLLCLFPWGLHTTNTALPSIVGADIENEFLAVPKFKEQEAISNFLDKKTSEIDALISDKKRLIALLEEKRQAVITETVTKGLDPNVPMKDSGIEWIGEIPEHWETIKIKYLAKNSSSLFLDGDWIESDMIKNQGIRYLTTGNIGKGKFKEQTKNYISKETFKQLNCLKAFPGDLAISRLNSPIGRSCILPHKEKYYVVAVDIVILRADSHHNKGFLNYCMNTVGYSENGALMSRGTTMKRVSRTFLGNFIIPITTTKEQNLIKNFLDEKTFEIDALVNEIENQISKLKEYRESLIYESVTGKIDVRDYFAEREEIY